MKDLPKEFVASLTNDFPKDFVSFSKDDFEKYALDWTRVYAPKPSCVTFPRTTAEVSAFVKLCNRHNIPIVPSGGRTGLAGGAVAASGEAVISLSRMNRIGPVDELAQTVRVQAGAVTEAVHQHCAPHGLTWPVDFASKGSSHVGGNIATNAGGLRVIRYGLTRNWVLGLQVVTPEGDVLELNGALEKNNTGIDLRQLFIGSEGILGIITEATLKLTRLPKDADVFCFAVKDLSIVFSLFKESRKAPFEIMAFECMTRNCVEKVSKHMGVKIPFETSASAYVLLEAERPSSESAKDFLDNWLAGLFDKGLVLDGTLAQSPREAKELWKLREGIGESLFQTGFVHKNDVALPVSLLNDFIKDMYEMFETRHKGVEIFLFGHLGDGNLHINTRKPDDMDREIFLKNCKTQDNDLFTLVKKHSGSISAEHGIGLLKKHALGFSRSPAEIAIFKAIKKALDPRNLLNPGKVFDR